MLYLKLYWTYIFISISWTLWPLWGRNEPQYLTGVQYVLYVLLLYQPWRRVITECSQVNQSWNTITSSQPNLHRDFISSRMENMKISLIDMDQGHRRSDKLTWKNILNLVDHQINLTNPYFFILWKTYIIKILIPLSCDVKDDSFNCKNENVKSIDSETFCGVQASFQSNINRRYFS